MAQDTLSHLESTIRRLTQPVLGQYPRPWMTDLTDPSGAEVFVVGANPATPYAPQQVGSHERFLNALFNRAGETCRALYNEVRGKSSGTRSHSDEFVQMLRQGGVTKILETNTVCFSTPKFKDVYKLENREGLVRGIEIFEEIFRIIRPRIMVVHGSGVFKSFKADHAIAFSSPPERSDEFPRAVIGETLVLVIPSLGRPKVDQWPFQRTGYLREIVRQSAEHLRTH